MDCSCYCVYMRSDAHYSFIYIVPPSWNTVTDFHLGSHKYLTIDVKITGLLLVFFLSLLSLLVCFVCLFVFFPLLYYHTVKLQATKKQRFHSLIIRDFVTFLQGQELNCFDWYLCMTKSTKEMRRMGTGS